MKIIDLTRTITADMPVYPGTEQPKLDPASTYERDHFRETLLTMFSHTGTHMDAPAHIVPGRTTLDAFDASQFTGTALVIDCRELNMGDVITLDFVTKYGSAANDADFLLFCTGHDKYWGRPEYFGDFPYPDDDVISYIISHNKKGIGFDTISADPISSLHNHKRLFSDNEIVIVENLTNLGELCGKVVGFCALPLKFENSDGAPVRAIAAID